MVDDGLARWALTALFGLSGVWFLLQAVRGGSWADRVCDALHATMSLAMVAMCWPQLTGRAVLAQVVVFGAAALWFAGLTLLPAGRRLPRRHDDDPWLGGLHVAMMAGMVWMLVAMPALHGADPATAATVPVLSGLGLIALLLAGTAVSATSAVPGRGADRRTGRGTRHGGIGWHLAHVAMGVGMVAMIAPMVTLV